MRIGVDLGGTKIEVAALDAAGASIDRRRTATPPSYRGTIDAICGLISATETSLGKQGTIGIGTPGSISPTTGLMRNANSVWLNDQALYADLTAALGRPIRMANDANCLALSEATDGAGAGFRTVFCVILGTGCGGGIVVDGRLLVGANGIAGEWGHAPLPWQSPSEFPGHACWCGRRGCLETYVSGPGLQRDFAASSGRADVDAAGVVAAARAGDKIAIDALARYIDRLGRGLAMTCDVFDPDVIVLGGGMSNVTELYEQLPSVIAHHVFADACMTPVLPARHGDSSGVRGAACLWSDAWGDAWSDAQ